jgi:hypothetical protein
VAIGGATLDKAKTYSMANNNFLARGSGGYSGSRGAKMLIDAKFGTVMASQVINHVSRPDNISLEIEGRITRQNENLH